MNKYRNAKGQFIKVIDKYGIVWTNKQLEKFSSVITDMAVCTGIEEMIKDLLSCFDLYNLQLILLNHPHFKDKL
jgi:hypothetical protein